MLIDNIAAYQEELDKAEDKISALKAEVKKLKAENKELRQRMPRDSNAEPTPEAIAELERRAATVDVPAEVVREAIEKAKRLAEKRLAEPS